VCVKRTGSHRFKLDRHDFTGIFLGYTATDQNIIYLNTTSGIVKSCHHAVFNEAWYLQPSRPTAAQLLYDLGIEDESTFVNLDGPVHPLPIGSIAPIIVPWPPPLQNVHKAAKPPPMSLFALLPLRLTAQPNSFAATAAWVNALPTAGTLASDIVTKFLIGPHDMAMIYMSPNPYGRTFEKEVDLRKLDITRHRTAGMRLLEKDGRLVLASINGSTPMAQIDRWQTHVRGAWLVSIDGTPVSTITEAQDIFTRLQTSTHPCILVFSHPETSPDISNKGLPIMSKEDFLQFTHDQLNNRLDLITDDPIFLQGGQYNIVESGNVHNYTMRVMRITRGRLLKQVDWTDWQDSEYLQLDQYDKQTMFGDPIAVDKDDAVFHLVWTYNIKALNGCKKARCVCDGSSRSGSVQVLDKTYANCVDQTSSRLFYAIAAAENLVVYGADVCNAFAEAPPPKQGFYVRPDRAFNEWWVNHKKRPPIPDGHVIPVLSAMQGQPESPRLWEKHADQILQELGLMPTVHKPCLYSSTINGNRIIFKRQVDDFAIAAPDPQTADILLDMLGNKLTMPVK
jgi:hypothetical protein